MGNPGTNGIDVRIVTAYEQLLCLQFMTQHEVLLTLAVLLQAVPGVQGRKGQKGDMGRKGLAGKRVCGRVGVRSCIYVHL